MDAWVAGMNDEGNIEKAIGEAQIALKKKQAKRNEEEKQAQLEKKESPDELKSQLLNHMRSGETVITAMKRLSGKRKEEDDLSSFIKKRRREHGDVTVNSETKKDKERSKRYDHHLLILLFLFSFDLCMDTEISRPQSLQHDKSTIELMTDIANQLLATGVHDIYDMSYEALQFQSAKNEDINHILWEYQGLDGVVYGPYKSKEIADWKRQGFLTGSTSVMIRRVRRNRKVR